MVDFEFLAAPVAVQREIFQFRLGQNLGVGLLFALRADQKTIFFYCYFHSFLLLGASRCVASRSLRRTIGVTPRPL